MKNSPPFSPRSPERSKTGRLFRRAARNGAKQPAFFTAQPGMMKNSPPFSPRSPERCKTDRLLGPDGVLACKTDRLLDLDGVLACKTDRLLGLDGVLACKTGRLLGPDGVLVCKTGRQLGARSITSPPTHNPPRGGRSGSPEQASGASRSRRRRWGSWCVGRGW